MRLGFRADARPFSFRDEAGNAAGEIREARWYDYIIVNDKFEEAVEQLKSVLIAEQCRTSRLLHGLSAIFDI